MMGKEKEQQELRRANKLCTVTIKKSENDNTKKTLSEMFSFVYDKKVFVVARRNIMVILSSVA